MNIPPLLKSKPVLYGGGLIIAATLFYRLFSKPAVNNITMTADGLSEGNLAMVQAAQAYNLQQESINAQKEIALQGFANERYITDAGIKILQENNASYLQALEENNQFALASQVSAQDYAFANQQEINALARYFRYEDAVTAQRQMQSDENKLNTQLAYQNAWISEDYRDKERERQQQYNLANYQAMIAHDIGKKQVGAQKTSSWLGAISNVLSAFVP
jgi:hypothetical protein